MVQVVLHRPLPSDLAHNTPVRARFWPWLEPFFRVKVFETIQVVFSPLERGPPDVAYPKCSRGAGVPHVQKNPPPYDPTVGLRLWSYGGPRGRRQFRMREVPL